MKSLAAQVITLFGRLACCVTTKKQSLGCLSISSALKVYSTAILLAFAGLTGAASVQHLDSGWEFYQGSLGSIWEIWRGDKATDNMTWTPVTLPHCFNARDSVDPDVRYYQGPGWYRTRLKVKNPFPNGRTLLHFHGAGQKSQV